MPSSLVRFVRNFFSSELAPPVSCIVDEVTPGRFKLYAEFVSGEQVLVVDVEPELDPKSAAYVRRKHYRCWPNGVANLKTSLIGDFYPSDVVGFLDAPGVVRVFSKHPNDWWFKAVIMLNDQFPVSGVGLLSGLWWWWGYCVHLRVFWWECSVSGCSRPSNCSHWPCCQEAT